MSRRHRRMNGRIRRALSDIKKMRRGVGKLVRKNAKNKGFKTESVFDDFLASILAKGLIKEIIPVKRCSYMDCVNNVDRIVYRLTDYTAVPIQVVSSFGGAAKFQKKYRNFFKEKYGCFPVIVVVMPSVVHRKNFYNLVLSKINNWNGHFRWRQWELEYSKFFDFERHSEFGDFEERKKMFLQDLDKIRHEKQKQENGEDSIPQLA